MKKIILVLTISFTPLGCTSTTSISANDCIKVANKTENNNAKSSNDVFNACLDKQHKKRVVEKGFRKDSLEGLLFFVIDMTAS